MMPSLNGLPFRILRTAKDFVFTSSSDSDSAVCLSDCAAFQRIQLQGMCPVLLSGPFCNFDGPLSFECDCWVLGPGGMPARIFTSNASAPLIPQAATPEQSLLPGFPARRFKVRLTKRLAEEALLSRRGALPLDVEVRNRGNLRRA